MRSLTRLPLAAVTTALCYACAGRIARSSVCAPVPEEFALAGQTVYPDCNVDRRARPSSLPRTQYTPSPGQTCLRAAIDIVVDSTGRPVRETARVVQSTDPTFALAVLNGLESVRFEPARKDGHRVAQLVHFAQALAARSPLEVRAPHSPPC